MSETIIKALIKLFALVADVMASNNMHQSGRSVVETYLKRHLNQEQVEQYLELFDNYFKEFHGGIEEGDIKKAKKRSSLNAMKVLSICEQVNEELKQDQKVLVLFQLLEFISCCKNASETELEFVETAADAFKISPQEFRNCKALVIDNTPDKIPFRNEILIIDNQAEVKEDTTKHIFCENLNGSIVILRTPCTNTYALKYIGEDLLYISGQHIVPGRINIFDKGSSIRSSKINPVYYSDIVSKFLQTEQKRKVILTLEDVTFKFKNSENGIQQFNFSEESGTLVGIMGGSGVGKSTLLNVMNGNLPPQSGRILINSFDIHKDKEKVEGIIGFIPQDDLLIDELSVYQNLYYSAKLCFRDFKEEEIKNTVEKVLTDLDLYQIKDLTVGSPLNKYISGGQRKRLNIALEIIREPYIMYVDEPTSGLSSMDSEMVMDLLKEQTLKGKLIIVNIHQPSSDIYKMFDKLIFMDKGGYPIYYGNPSDAVIYFKTITNFINADESQCVACGNVNPEQVLQIIEAKVVDEYGKLTKNRKVSAKEWFAYYTNNILPKLKRKETPPTIPKSSFRIPGLFSQFKIFTMRDIRSKLTNTQYLAISLLEAPLLALILGYVTRHISNNSPNHIYLFSENENLPAYIFMCVVVSLFLGMTISAEEIFKDKKIRQRETFLNLSRFSYLNSKVSIMFFLSAIQMLLFVLIGNSLIDIKGMTLTYWLVLFSTSCLANMIGLNISSAFNSVITIYILIPFLLVPQLIFSGTIIKFEKLNNTLTSDEYVPLIGDVMPSRWAYEALAVAQFKNNKFEKYFFDSEKAISNNSYYADNLISDLENRNNKIAFNINKPGTVENLTTDFLVLKNEIQNIEKISDYKFCCYEDLNASKYNSDVSAKINNYLAVNKDFFTKVMNRANAKKDKIYNELSKKLSGESNVIKLRQKYFNNGLADLVLNNSELIKIYEKDGHLVRTKTPVYKEPGNNLGRAHFYASTKNIFGYKIDTLWFNIIILWIFSAFFYTSLYFDWLKKILESGEKLGKLILKNISKKK